MELRAVTIFAVMDDLGRLFLLDVHGRRRSATTSTNGMELGMAEKPAAVTAKQLRKLLEDQKYRCAYTGAELTPETASLDHVIPLGKGGAHAVGNFAIVRHDVNTAKGTLTYDEFVALCRSVVSYADRQGGA